MGMFMLQSPKTLLNFFDSFHKETPFYLRKVYHSTSQGKRFPHSLNSPLFDHHRGLNHTSLCKWMVCWSFSTQRCSPYQCRFHPSKIHIGKDQRNLKMTLNFSIKQKQHNASASAIRLNDKKLSNCYFSL